MVPSYILLPMYLVNGTIGLTMGLYLYTYGLCVVEGLHRSDQYGGGVLAVPGLPFTLSPECWALLVLVWLMIAIALFEFPTGVYADVFGRKTATTISMACRVGFFACYAVAAYAGRNQGHGNAGLVVWSSLAGLTFLALHTTLRSGSFSGWLRDSLEVENRAEQFVVVSARGRFLHQLLFIPGAFASLLLHLNNLIHVAYLIGGLASLCCLVVLPGTMRENTQYTFARTGELFSAKAWEVFREAVRVALEGLAIFRSRRVLWSVALYSTAVWATWYLMDYFWMDIFSKKFPDLLGRPLAQGAPAGVIVIWCVLLGFFIGLSALGNYLLQRVVARPSYQDLGTNGPLLALLNLQVSVLFALPLFGIWLGVFLGVDDSRMALVLFTVLIGVFKLADGAIEPLLDGVENVHIPDNEKARATVLSIFSLLRNLVIGLILAGIVILPGEACTSEASEGLVGWLWAGSAFAVVATALLLLVTTRMSGSAGGGDPGQKAVDPPSRPAS